MVDLKCFKKMNIYFFGSEAEKRDFYLYCICPFFEQHKKGRYFAAREWNGGPNVEVIYDGEKVSKRKLRSVIDAYCKKNNLSWSTKQIRNNLSSYRKNQANLLKMERKRKVRIFQWNHLKIRIRKLDMVYYRRTYNSSDHIKLHFESRFLLQPLMVEALMNITNKQDMNLLIMRQYLSTMRLFEHGEKFASMMYFSNIMGVFGVAKVYGKENAFRTYFKKEYSKYDISELEIKHAEGSLEQRFDVAWARIYQKCVELVDGNKLTERGYFDLRDQEARATSNMIGLESDFHQALLKDERLHDIISSKTHLVFRSIANILYNIMPSLNVTFLDKHFCCYAVVNYIMEKYNTDWKEIMAQRVF